MHLISARRAAGIITAVGALAIGGGIATSAAAGASPGISVTLSASSGDGASATFNPAGDIVLTTGADVSDTYAMADLNGVAGTAAPSTPPSFTTSAYAAGSPRWVIEFSNDNFITGYPVQMGSFDGVTPTATFTGDQWGVGNGSSYTTYADALAGAGVTGSVTVSDAYIIEDGDQPSTTDTISDALYNGEALVAGTPAPKPTPSSSTGSTGSSTTPVGGVQTGGGKPVSDPLVPVGAGVAGLGLLLGGAAFLRRRQQG